MLALYAGQPIVVNGKSSYVNGSLLTYFSARQAQRDDPYSNESLGGIPDPVFPNVAGRDATRLENFAAQNGSASSGYPVDELLLGGAVPTALPGRSGDILLRLTWVWLGPWVLPRGGTSAPRSLQRRECRLPFLRLKKGSPLN